MENHAPEHLASASVSRDPQRLTESSGFSQTLAVLRIKNFRILEIGMLLSMAAMQMNLISRSWLAYHISGSAVALGLVALARGLPHFILSPIAGVAADRLDKRTLLMVTQSGMAVMALTNAVLVHLGIIQIWHLVVLGLAQGAAFPFTMPTRQAMIPYLAGESRLAQGFAIDSAIRNLNRVLAPSIGGLLIAWHPVIAFYAIAVAYAGATLSVAMLPSVAKPHKAKTGVLEDLAEGVRYITGNRILLVLIGTGFIAIILGRPIIQFLPVFEHEVLNVTARELGFMYTAIGVGALAGSAILAGIANSPRRGAIQMGCGILFGAGICGFAVSHWLVVSLLALVLVGVSSEGYMTLNRVEVITYTDEKFRGRVLGIYVMTWALMPISALPFGYIVDRLGPVTTFAGAGCLMIGVLVLVMVVYPGVWRSRRPITWR